MNCWICLTNTRFIPTPVGNIAPRPLLRHTSPVHPHACGEHSIEVSFNHFLLRFIPTPVGNIWQCRLFFLMRPVHPHACGEHSRSQAAPFIFDGSSPRLWGTWVAGIDGRPGHRFIPTPVGNMRWTRRIRTRYSVHPHACGEHRPLSFGHFLVSGSSPRLWGTFARYAFFVLILRFIPTPVGNILSARVQEQQRAVHPHACGEHRFIGEQAKRLIGSSPRLWGT